MYGGGTTKPSSLNFSVFVPNPTPGVLAFPADIPGLPERPTFNTDPSDQPVRNTTSGQTGTTGDGRDQSKGETRAWRLTKRNWTPPPPSETLPRNRSSSTSSRSQRRIAINVEWSPCSNGNPIPRSVARETAAITSAVRTLSFGDDAVSVTKPTVGEPHSRGTQQLLDKDPQDAHRVAEGRSLGVYGDRPSL